MTFLTVSPQNGIGHSPGSSVTTSNSSWSRIMRRNQSWASRAEWTPYSGEDREGKSKAYGGRSAGLLPSRVFSDQLLVIDRGEIESALLDV